MNAISIAALLHEQIWSGVQSATWILDQTRIYLALITRILFTGFYTTNRTSLTILGWAYKGTIVSYLTKISWL
jgi:hypothetical protein